jgi:hypothetical protein
MSLKNIPNFVIRIKVGIFAHAKISTLETFHGDNANYKEIINVC